MNPYILCKNLSFETLVAQKVIHTSGANSLPFCWRGRKLWKQSKQQTESRIVGLNLRKKLFFRTAGNKIHLLRRLAINRKFTFKILSPVLRIPSWPAGPFSEIFEIKIPYKRKQKNIAIQTCYSRLSYNSFLFSSLLCPGDVRRKTELNP